MDDHQALKAELALVDQQIADASTRAADLEDVVGVMHALKGDAAPADRALMATYHALGLLSRRRARLLTMVAGHEDGHDAG